MPPGWFTLATGKRLHWVVEIGGRTKTWDSEITRQVPDQEIDWLGFGDPDNRGRLVFEEADGGTKTRVTLALDYEPKGAVEGVADKLWLRPAQGGTRHAELQGVP